MHDDDWSYLDTLRPIHAAVASSEWLQKVMIESLPPPLQRKASLPFSHRLIELNADYDLKVSQKKKKIPWNVLLKHSTIVQIWIPKAAQMKISKRGRKGRLNTTTAYAMSASAILTFQNNKSCTTVLRISIGVLAKKVRNISSLFDPGPRPFRSPQLSMLLPYDRNSLTTA